MAEEGIGVLMAGAAVKGATTAVAKKFIDEVVGPYLRGMTSKKAESVLKKKLSKYARVIEHKTRVVSTFVNIGGVLSLEDVYEPLTVFSTSGGFEALIDSYPSSLFSKSRCVALTDDAGMGKSTLAKFIVRKSLSEGKNIPLLVELRRVRSGQTILECLSKELTSSNPGSVEYDSLMDLFARGNFIFMLDGFDEVEEALRPEIVSEVNEMAAKFPFCYFVLTSRPEYSVSLFPDFYQVGIRKLTKEQAHSLIRRYDAGRGLAKLLIPKIGQAQIGYFLGNPLLVTLLYRAFDHRNSVPPKRTMFFRQVYDALFQDHDLGKGDAFSRIKESGLDSEDFHKLLRALGFETFKSGRVSFSDVELLAFIDLAVERADLSVVSKRVMQDLIKAVPIFLRDGVEIKWCHKSFQEYFASQYIISDMASLRDDLLRKMFDSPEVERYREIFRFVGECEIGLLREICIFPLIKAFSAKAGRGLDFELASLFRCVDIYYIGGIQKRDYSKSPQELVYEKLGLNLDGRRTAMTWGPRRTFVLISALKENGAKFLLLPVIDPKMFPEFVRRNRSSFVPVWGKTFGSVSFHINPTSKELKKICQRLGAIEHLEAAANLHTIKDSALVSLKQSAARRKASLVSCVLDDF